MEQLRRIARRVVNAKEKVVFALMVMVLIWRVVQIINPPAPPRPDSPKPVPVEVDNPGNPATQRFRIEDFASVTTQKWSLPDTFIVPQEEEQDEGIPDIQFKGAKEIGTGKYYAQISLDGRSPQLVAEGRPFAGRRAILNDIDVEANKIRFTWVLTGKKYEREMTE